MKKTLTINISGIVFHIDEDAFERLDRYIEKLKSYFRNTEGNEEIIADIEGRIAEILQGKVRDGKEVINLEDIEEVIGVMGQPDEFDAGEEPAPGPAGHIPQSKRLYRDPERKILGGVCSGIAAYFFIDPLWIRILFIFLAFSGFGLLLYLILWIAVPEARTTAEKLEMRGQPVNISTIEQSIKDEFGDLEERLNGITDKARETYRQRKAEFDRDQRPRMARGFSNIGQILLRVLLIFTGIVVFITGLILTVAFLAILFRFPETALLEPSSPGFFPLYPALDLIFNTDADLRTFATGLIVVTGIPLLMILWAGIRLIFGLPRARFISGIASFIWICALVITLVFGFKAFNAFRYEAESRQEKELDLSPGDTLSLITRYRLPDDLDWSRSGYFHFQECRMALANDEQVFYGIPLLRIKPAKDSLNMLARIGSACGPFRDEAEENAERIVYDWSLSGDSLILSDSYRLAPGEKWRRQELRLELLLPEGAVVRIDRNSSRILARHGELSRRDLSGGVFVMTEDGLERIGK